MTMTEKTPNSGDIDLEAFFEAGRAARPVPGDDFLARVDASAKAALAKSIQSEPVSRAAATDRRGFFSWLGGWPVVAGLATAAVAGVWIGYTAPSIADFGAATTEIYDLGGLLPGYVASDDWSS